ncbi:MAG: zinc-binding dehydrogenase [Planctomycetes bacterium]|nr:zinc-binding dehydrogenase [Planctomycetota bacterium]
MRQVWITRHGEPEVLQVRESPDPTAGAGTVRVRVKAAGINFADILARLGLYPDAPKPPAVVGYEVSGVIDQVGPEARRFREGDRVIGVCRFGGYSDTVVLPETAVFPLPPKMSFSEGAAIPVNYLTVYQMLFVMGSIKSGERVLVHSAAGGVGLAAIDLCRIAGAEVIGTASTPKHERLRERGVSHVVDSRVEDFESAVMRITEGKGVHIILDPIGGKSWAKGLRCLAPTGRLVTFGFSSAVTGKRRSVFALVKRLAQVPWLKFNPLTLMNENKAIVGVNLGHMWHMQDEMRRWGEQILGWYEEGRMHPTVDKEFRFEEAPKAHHYIQDRMNFGKVLLVS